MGNFTLYIAFVCFYLISCTKNKGFRYQENEKIHKMNPTVTNPLQSKYKFNCINYDSLIKIDTNLLTDGCGCDLYHNDNLIFVGFNDLEYIKVNNEIIKLKDVDSISTVYKKIKWYSSELFSIKLETLSNKAIDIDASKVKSVIYLYDKNTKQLFDKLTLEGQCGC